MDLKTCYYELGIGLGLPPHELTAIQDKTVGTPLAGILLAWLNRHYNTEWHGLPTWRRLVEAVDNPVGGNNHELAKTIASKHTSGTKVILLCLNYNIGCGHVTCTSSSSPKRI
jgi:hypothetical protein